MIYLGGCPKSKLGSLLCHFARSYLHSRGRKSYLSYMYDIILISQKAAFIKPLKKHTFIPLFLVYFFLAKKALTLSPVYAYKCKMDFYYLMQYMTKKLLIFLVSTTFVTSIFAQDPVFSQFYANKMYLNPAFTGFHLGTVANINYRSQWAGVRKGYSKFETKSVGVSTILPCYNSGFGLIYTEDVRGEGQLKAQKAGFSYAYQYVNDNDRHNTSQLGMGFRVSYNWQSFVKENLVFSDQLSALDGIIG